MDLRLRGFCDDFGMLPLGTVTSGATLTLKNVVLNEFANEGGSYSAQIIHVRRVT